MLLLLIPPVLKDMRVQCFCVRYFCMSNYVSTDHLKYATTKLKQNSDVDENLIKSPIRNTFLNLKEHFSINSH